MKHIIGSCIALLSSSIYAATISKIEPIANIAGSYQLVFKDAGVQPRAFTTSEPNAAIILDFPNTSSNIGREFKVEKSGIYNVDIHDSTNRTRAVINLAFPMKYNISMKNNDVIVSIDTSGIVQAPTKKPVTTSTPGVVNKGLSPMFRRGEGENKGIFLFNLPSEKTIVNVKNQGNNIVADIAGYRIENNEQKRLDVTDYASPVGFVDIKRTSNGTRINLNMGKNDYDFIAYQTGTTYAIEVSKPQEANKNDLLKQIDGFNESKEYKGEALSLNFQDVEVRAVLQIIADFTNKNIVVSDSVAGNITLRLENVPWDQALDIILKTKGLGKRVNNNVIYISLANELDRAEIEALDNLQEKNSKTPTKTDLIQIKYADANAIKTVIEASRQYGNNNNATDNSDAILSPKGRVTVDPRSNTLIVSDVPIKLQAVRELIAKLDEPVRQVLVDARIVSASENVNKELSLGFTPANATASGARGDGTRIDGTVNTPGLIPGNTGYQNNRDYQPYTAPNLAPVNGQAPSTPKGIADRLGLSIGNLESGAQLGLAILSGDFLVGLELKALQNDSVVEILSSPRVVTQDGVEASITKGTKIPYTTRQKDGSATTELEDAALSLKVKPRITPDNMINMELKITDDSQGGTVQGENGGQLVIINNNELNTTVLVDNGETLVLGGLYKQNISHNKSKVPVMGDIPIIGAAFRRSGNQVEKSELLMFITPRIIDKRLVQYDKFSNLHDK